MLDQFASLSSYSDDTSAVGGYRVLPPRRAASRTTRRASSKPSRGGARLRWTGSLSVLFIGGLGLAVLAGPANCPCSSAMKVAELSSVARLGYVQNAAMMTEREMIQPETDLPRLSTATPVDANESAVGVSPITTSALVPTRETPSVATEAAPSTSAGRLPVKIEQVADAKPEHVKVAAASDVTTDVPPTLPVIEVANPPEASDEATPPAKKKSADKSRTAKKRALRAYRTSNEVTLRAKAGAPVGDPTKQAPKWAQQMFVNPWQSRAFSYTQ